MEREDPAIIDGELDFLLEDNEQIIMYKRACMRQTLLVVANGNAHGRDGFPSVGVLSFGSSP